MQHTKRWLAVVLIAAMTLGDCGSFIVSATENITATEDSVSENHIGISEKPASDIDLEEGDDKEEILVEPPEITEPDSEAAIAASLPALHIGQITKGDTLPVPDDLEFSYDQPISFETSNDLLLFANYNIDTTLDTEKGTLEWSILRGEKGLVPGSTGLLDEKDDWTGFETVSSSPFFVMEEIADEESEYDQMMSLTPIEISSAVDTIESHEIEEAAENYDYYIRVAYYPESELLKKEAFYTAVTLPFLPQNTVTEIPEDTPDTENDQTDIAPDETAVTETADQEEIPDIESVDATSADSETVENESDTEQAAEDSVSDNSVSDNSVCADPITVLSENDNEDDSVPQPTKNSVGVLTVSTENVTLHNGDTLSVSAAITPKSIIEPITWKSDDANVATVTADTANNTDQSNAVITAVAEGDTQITASCGTLTATVMVHVVKADENEVYDLSGDIWISGFKKEDEALVYTGQKITQTFQVYYKETLLKEKTDYTLSYKNNVNAAAWDAVKAPNVTITMKGQYQGSRTLYYTIYPTDITKLDIYNPANDNSDDTDDGDDTSSGYKQTVLYSKNLKLPTPELTFGKKKLAINKDFICDYTTLQEELYQQNYKKGDSYIPGRIYHYTVNGIGNFTGSISMQLVLLRDKNLNFSSASVKLSEKQYEYHGMPLTKSDVTITKLTINRKELDNALYDYEVHADGIDGAYIMVYPTAESEMEYGYFGYKKVALKLVGDRNIKEAALGTAWKETLPFSQKTVNDAGGIFQEKTGVLTFTVETGSDTLTEGQDYTVKYTNAKKAGTVTVTFTGKGRYKGKLTKKYNILPNIDKKNFTIRWKNVTREGDGLAIVYQKGGAVPEFILLDQDDNILKNKTDYTIKLKDNKAPGDMTCEITGKGNYKGYTETVQITVKNAVLSQCALSVPDKAYSTKANAWKSKVTIKDVNGKTLQAGKDYEKEVVYSYTGMDNGQPPAAGTTVTVTVTGIGFYAGDDASERKSSLTGQYRIFQNNINKLQIVIDNQEYTGKAIALSSSAIHVYANATDKRKKIELPNAADCYQIVEYKNNIKAGTAKVTLRGTGEYGGTRTCSFKIIKKAYLINRVSKIALDKKNLDIFLAEKKKRTLTATITPKDASQVITNPTVIWTTSNSSIATVKAIEPAADDPSDTETTAKNTISVAAEITVYKTGNVTITAIAQDGNKRAACQLKVSVPALKDKGKTIKKKTGETYQLGFTNPGNYEVDPESFTFESSNTSVASVDSKGLVTMNRFGMVTIQVYVGNRQAVQQCSFIVKKVSDDELNDSKVLTYHQEPGCKNDTPAINQLLRTAEWSKGRYDTVYIPAGTYHIDTVGGDFGGLVLTDNQNLVMSPDARLEAIPNNSENYQVIWAFGRQNVTITGGKIVGDRNKHKGGGEWGHGIKISGCTNVYISDVEVSNCWGDGIYLGFYDGPNKSSNRITIENCNLHHNRRNNLSVTDVSNVTIDNCQFNNAKGTDPQYGIDIEPNAGRTCSNVTITNSTFKGNAKGTIQILGQLNAHVKGVRIENCTGDREPLIWQGFGGSVSGVTQKNNHW